MIAALPDEVEYLTSGAIRTWDMVLIDAPGNINHIAIVDKTVGDLVMVAESNLGDDYLGHYTAYASAITFGVFRMRPQCSRILSVANREYSETWAVYVPVGVVPEGAGHLACAFNWVCATIEVTETNLGDGIGIYKVQRGPGWSSRMDVPESGDATWANMVIDPARCVEELIDDVEGIRMRPARSLGEDFGEAVTLETAYTCPCAIADSTAIWATGYKDGNQYLLRRDRGIGHKRLDATPVLIGSGDEKAGAIAQFPATGALVLAYQNGDDTNLHVSGDRGETCPFVLAVKDLLTPAMWAIEDDLWLCGYRPGIYQGADGSVVALRFRPSTLGLEQIGNEVICGPADAGRPAIIAHPTSGAIMVLSVKTQDWLVSNPTPGIAEYRSTDSGQTWQLKEVHAIA